MRTTFLAAAAATAMISTAAFAAVIFNEATGGGFVGKGDVQTALGFNNSQMQANAANLKFRFEQQGKYEVTCSYQDFNNINNPDGPGKIKEYFTAFKDFKQTLNINAKVAYDARTHKQVDGFHLTGYSNNSDPRDLSCPSDGKQYTFEEATDVEITSGGLTVNNIPLAY